MSTWSRSLCAAASKHHKTYTWYGHWTYKTYDSSRPLVLQSIFCEKTVRKPKSKSSTMWSLRLRLSQIQNEHYDEGSQKAGRYLQCFPSSAPVQNTRKDPRRCFFWFNFSSRHQPPKEMSKRHMRLGACCWGIRYSRDRVLLLYSTPRYHLSKIKTHTTPHMCCSFSEKAEESNPCAVCFAVALRRHKPLNTTILPSI